MNLFFKLCVKLTFPCHNCSSSHRMDSHWGHPSEGRARHQPAQSKERQWKWHGEAKKRESIISASPPPGRTSTACTHTRSQHCPHPRTLLGRHPPYCLPLPYELLCVAEPENSLPGPGSGWTSPLKECAQVWKAIRDKPLPSELAAGSLLANCKVHCSFLVSSWKACFSSTGEDSRQELCRGSWELLQFPSKSEKHLLKVPQFHWDGHCGVPEHGCQLLWPSEVIKDAISYIKPFILLCLAWHLLSWLTAKIWKSMDNFLWETVEILGILVTSVVLI